MDDALRHTRTAKLQLELAQDPTPPRASEPAEPLAESPKVPRRRASLETRASSRSIILTIPPPRLREDTSVVVNLANWFRYTPTLLLFGPLTLVLLVSSPVHIDDDDECAAVGASRTVIVGLGGGALVLLLLTQLVAYGRLEALHHHQLQRRGVERLAELAMLDLAVLGGFAAAYVFEASEDASLLLLLAARGSRLLLGVGLARLGRSLTPVEASDRLAPRARRGFALAAAALAGAVAALALTDSVQLVRVLMLLSSVLAAFSMLLVTQHSVRLHRMGIPFKKHFVLAASLFTQAFLLQGLVTAADFVDAGLSGGAGSALVTIELDALVGSVADLLPHLVLQGYLARHVSGATNMFAAGSLVSRAGLGLLLMLVVMLSGMAQAHATCVSPLGQCASEGTAAFVTRFGVGAIETLIPLIFVSVCPSCLTVIDRQRIGPVLPRVRGSLVPVHKLLSALLVAALGCHVYGHLTIRAHADAIHDCLAALGAPDRTLDYLSRDEMALAWPWVTGACLVLCFGVCVGSGVLRGAGVIGHPTFNGLHKVAAAAAIPLLVVHGLDSLLAKPKLYMWVLVTCFLWVIGLTATDTKSTAAEVSVLRARRGKSTVSVVRFPMPFGPSPGCWVLARIPQLDSIAHPFTLAGSPADDGYGELHVAATPNPHGWTQRLAGLQSESVDIYLEGPFRSDLSSPDLWRASRVLFIVSSTGFTALDAWISALRCSPDGEERFEQLYVLFMTSPVGAYLERAAETLRELPPGHVFSSYPIPLEDAEAVPFRSDEARFALDGKSPDEQAELKTQLRVERVLDAFTKGEDALPPFSTISVAICGRSLVARGAQQAAKQFRRAQWTFEWFSECFDS